MPNHYQRKNLTPTEMIYLQTLCSGNACTREKLYHEAHSWRMYQPNELVVRAHISKLRKKLATVGIEIHNTERGTDGYIIRPQHLDAARDLFKREGVL